MSAAKAPRTAAWLLPEMIEGSGGHRTMLQNIEAMLGAGYHCDLYVQRPRGDERERDEASAVSARQMRDFFGFDPDRPGCRVFSGLQCEGEYDAVFATAWWTARVASNWHAKHKAYFVQDFESYFNPMGDGYLMAENSYRLGLTPITIGRWLTQKLTREHECTATWFEFCADLSVYRRQAGRQRDQAVAFICQPEKPRRCPRLGLEALSIVKRMRPGVEIRIYGSREKTDLWFDAEQLGLVTVEQCADLYNSCQVGLCISSSNPSRIPFEMMACGLPVVDIHRENNLCDMPDGGVLLAEQKPEELARAIVMLLDDKARCEVMGSYGSRFMRDRDLSVGFSQFLGAVEDLLAGRLHEWRERARTVEPFYSRPRRLPPAAAQLEIKPVPEEERERASRAQAEFQAMMRASHELAEIEGSRAWRMAMSLKDTPIYRAYASRRYGEGWRHANAPEEQDPRLALDRVTRSRAYRLIRGIKGSGLYRWYRKSK